MLRPHFVWGLWGPPELARQHKNSESLRGSTHLADSAPTTHKRDANAALLLFFVYSHVKSIRAYDGRVDDGKRLQALNV